MRLATVAVAGWVATLVACGAPTLDRVRYANAPPVWRVNDRRHVAEKPKVYKYIPYKYAADELAFVRISHHLRVPNQKRAHDVNSLGEVPNSTWFRNRLGVRNVSPDDIARGPGDTKGPDLTGPLVIKSSKIGGGSVGFIVEDRTGSRYLLKFDEAGLPVLETATDVIVQRILWASGYNVPENNVVFVTRESLQLTPESKYVDSDGNKRLMTPADLDRELATLDRQPDGSYRTLASKYLLGTPLGGISPRGTRSGDRNDVLDHQHRRSLRGLYVFYSWLQATDVHPGNSLDMWVTDPRDSRRRYVMHYLVDFGKSLGVFGKMEQFPADGHAEHFDVVYDFLSIFTFGLWSRPWEDTESPDLVGLAPLDAKHFNPGAWRPTIPWHPFRYLDPADGYWGAKIMMRFSRQHLRAAVQEGKLTSSRATDTLVDTLVKRQRKAGAYWFGKVAPLDGFVVEERRGGALRLCFDDLYLVYGFGDKVYGHGATARQRTRYRATAYDYNGRPTTWAASAQPRTTDGPTACLGGLRSAAGHAGYTIVRIEVARGGDENLPPIEVHLARDKVTGLPRIVGLNRR